MNSSLTFAIAKSKEDFIAAFPLIQILNPKLCEADYWLYVRDMQSFGNYSLYLAYAKEQLVGITGCWIATKFYCGKYLEVDNFIVAPNAQRQGYGSDLLEFVDQLAQEAHCDTIMLDAYLENEGAHLFYKQHGYKASGYHFLKELRNT